MMHFYCVWYKTAVMNLEGECSPCFSSHVKPRGRSDSDWLHAGSARARRRRLNFPERIGACLPLDT